MPHLDSPRFLPDTPRGALQGLTLLAVEDSRYAGEALRLMANRAGARLRRADSLATAQWHLELYTPDLILIDIGLPDGSGVELIQRLHLQLPELPIVAMSGESLAMDAALEAGAGLFLEKPLPSFTHFQEQMLSLLPGRHAPVSADQPLRPDPLALSEDLARAAMMLKEELQLPQRLYLAQFLAGIARHTRDGALARAAQEYRRSQGATKPYLTGLLRIRLGETPRPF